jgi:hypothetical protein
MCSDGEHCCIDVNNGGWEENFVEDINMDNEDLVEDMDMDNVRVRCA